MIGNSLCMQACLGEKIDWRLQKFARAQFFRDHAHHAWILQVFSRAFDSQKFIYHRHMCGIWPIATASNFFRTNHIYFVVLDSGAMKYSIMCACMYICMRDMATYIAYRALSSSINFLNVDLEDAVLSRHCINKDIIVAVISFNFTNHILKFLHQSSKNYPLFQDEKLAKPCLVLILTLSPQTCTVQRHAATEIDTARILFPNHKTIFLAS